MTNNFAEHHKMSSSKKVLKAKIEVSKGFFALNCKRQEGERERYGQQC